MAYKRNSPIPVIEGGTQQTSFTANAPIVAGGTSTAALAQITTDLNTAGYVLTANSSGAPTFQAAAGGITTIDGDTSSVTGSTVTLTGGTSGAVFTGDGASTITESFNFLNLPITAQVSNSPTAGYINIGGGATVFHTYSKSYATQPNVFVGYQSGGGFALIGNPQKNCALGDNSLYALTQGSYNAAIGSRSLATLTTGARNCALGYATLNSLVSGSNNVAIGDSSLGALVTGINNVAIGHTAGDKYTGAESNNILIGSYNTDVVGESNVCRIGAGTGSSTSQLSQTFISGIAGITTVVADAVPVLISASTGQLGTVTSSIRYKENIQDMADVSSGLLNLRPVTFDYIDKPNHKRQVGLIAEEVSEIMPDLVVKVNGEIETVKYQDLSVLLLNELQKAVKRIEVLEAKLSSECKG